jgi:hypothetical protein
MNAERQHNNIEERVVSFLDDIGLNLRKTFLNRAWQHAANTVVDAASENYWVFELCPSSGF